MFQMGRNHQDDAAKLIGIFVVIVVAIFSIAIFYSLAATLNVDRAITYLEDNGYTVFAAGEVPKVTLVTPAVDADSSTTASPSGLEFITDDLTILRGCADSQVLKWVELTDIWNCASDNTIATTGASVALDLGDNDINESDALLEIATTNDTNSVFTEPTDAKLLVDLAVNWPTADTADALSVDPTDCTGDLHATSIDTVGDLGCSPILATWVQVFNNTGSTLSKGDAVHLSGWNVGQGATEVDLADNDDVSLMPAIGLIQTDILTGVLGYIVLQGLIEDVDTSSWSAGDALYVNGTPGAVTSTRPTSTSSAVQTVGVVLRSHASAGVIQVLGGGRANDTPNNIINATFDANGTGNVLSNVETGDIADDTLLEADLDAVDTAADEECLTYEATGLGFEWQACASGSGDVTDVGDCTGSACFTADGTGTLLYFEGATADGFETIIGSDDITGADKTVNFPDDEIIDDDIVIGDGTSSLAYVALTDCNAATDGITYDTATNTFGCNTLGSHTTDTGPSPDCSGTTTYQDGEGGCDTLDAGTDITADLEEEAHCAEHSSADLDCSTETLIFAADSVDLTEIVQSNTLAGNPGLLIDECFFIATAGGGGLICEGSTADTAEQLYLFPDVNGSDTTSRIVIDNTEVTSIDGTGLTISTGVLEADLGTSIDTSEIDADTILEINLDATNEATDEYCLTFESGAGGDFEWEVCSSGVIILTTGSDGDSTTTSNDSGLEDIGGSLTIIRGCNNAHTLIWAESTDTWECALIHLRDEGSDADSTTTTTGSGLEFISGDLTLIRGCSDNEALVWDEDADNWRCVTLAGTGLTVTADTLSVDLGTEITTGEITDGEILEADLDAADSAVDEECLTYEEDSLHFEWQSCAGTVSIVDPGADEDSSNTGSASGLENIGSDLSLLRGCTDDQTLLWVESTDTWECSLITLRDQGTDADSTTTTTGSGLEFISGDLTLIRGCSDNEFLSWDEATDQWRCITFSTGITVSGDNVTADLGIAVDTTEITNDTILEIDLDAVDEAVDEDCLTYELDNLGFEWQSCGTTTSLVNPGSNGDSTTTVTASGLENIAGELTIIRGCADNQILSWDESTDVWRCVTVAGTGITVTADTFDVDLGTSIETGEITDDEILEADLDAVDEAIDEECLTYESSNSGFEWQSCSSISLVDPGSDGDSETQSSKSGLENIGSDLTLLRGCNNNEILTWTESTDSWDCTFPRLHDNGSDGDSTTSSTGSGLEYVSGNLTIIRGCTDDEVLGWDEATDQWRCIGFSTGLTVSGDSVTVDLGTEIDTSEITDDTITEPDLNILDVPVDEECLTYEDTTSDFEWQTCGSTLTLVNPGSNGDSTTTVTASGLETISGELTLIRGCSDDDFLAWDESTDVWRCITDGDGITFSGDTITADLGTEIDTTEITNDTVLEIDLSSTDEAGDEECLTYESPGFEWQPCSTTSILTTGIDGDTETRQSDSGLELLVSDLALLRGCTNSEVLVWDEAIDEWVCSLPRLLGAGVDADSSTAVTGSGLEYVSGELTIIRGCSDNEILSWDEDADNWRCLTNSTGLTVTGNNLTVDLGIAIDSTEITNDEILEIDLKSVDEAVDEECLTFETDNSGFEWQSCGSTSLVNPGSDGDSETGSSKSGLEIIGSDVTVLRGCTDNQGIVWTESTDSWDCSLTRLVGAGTDADSTLASTGSGLEYINGELTIIRGCDDNEVLGWDEDIDLWRCITLAGDGLTVTGDILAADLGTAIDSSEITNDVILEIDLNALDEAGDEECLTFEDTGSDFEWQSCGSITLVDPGVDADSVAGNSPSGLETIGGELSVLRGCANTEILTWEESTDQWYCGRIAVLATGTDNDSTTTTTGSGLEFINGELTIIRGCVDDEVLGWDEGVDLWRCVSVAGDGLTWSGDTLVVDLGTEIDSTEITNDTILEIDLNALDTAGDEECLTFEDTTADFEWQPCGGVTLVTEGTDGDSGTRGSDSGLETIGSNLTLLRGCTNSEILVWDESIDEWDCGLPRLRDGGSDADSTISTTGSGLEYIDGDLTIIRGCTDEQVLSWEEDTDTWDCQSPGGSQNLFETITDGSTNIVADSTTDTFTIATSGSASSTIFDSGTDTMTIVVDAVKIYSEKAAMFVQTGDVDLVLGIENVRIYNTFGSVGTMQEVTCWVNTAGTSSTITIDVNMEGVSIMGGSEVDITAGNFRGSSIPSTIEFGLDSYLQIEMDAVDSGDTGADLTCSVNIRFPLYNTN